MKLYQKIVALILALMMLVAVVGCAKDNATASTDETSSATDTSSHQEGSTSQDGTKQENSSVDIGDTLDSKIKLRFNSNGEFKVMVLADLHLNSSGLPESMGE